MGRKTWESLPDGFRPLPGRENIVVTRQQDWQADGARRAVNIEAAVRGLEKVWVIGGAEIFAQAVTGADRLEVTELDLSVEGDTYAPNRDGWRLVSAGQWQTSRTGVRYRFLSYER